MVESETEEGNPMREPMSIKEQLEGLLSIVLYLVTILTFLVFMRIVAWMMN